MPRRKADRLSRKVAAADAEDDQGKAEADARCKDLEIPQHLLAQHAVEDEARQHHREDDAHHPRIVLAFQDSELSQRRPACHEEIDGEHREDDCRGRDQGGEVRREGRECRLWMEFFLFGSVGLWLMMHFIA